MSDSEDLPSRFFSEARLVFQSQKARIDFSVEDVCRIADDPAMSSAFVQKFRAVNDPDLQGLIVDHLHSIAEGLHDSAEKTDIFVELVDRAGLGVTVSVTVAAVAAIVATGGAAAGPILMLFAGAGGTAVCGIGRTRLKVRSADVKSASRKIGRLADRLKALR